LEQNFTIRDWDQGVPMDNMNASKHLVLAMAAVVLAAAIGLFWLVGGKKPSQARADTAATTETAAASAGAKVTPTEPKLRIEPK
jgi:hypothetical protein